MVDSWRPGGRIFLNENPTSAAKRKLKEELGLINIKKFKFLGVAESRFRKGRFKIPSHTISIVFLVELDQKNI